MLLLLGLGAVHQDAVADLASAVQRPATEGELGRPGVQRARRCKKQRTPEVLVGYEGRLGLDGKAFFAQHGFCADDAEELVAMLSDFDGEGHDFGEQAFPKCMRLNNDGAPHVDFECLKAEHKKGHDRGQAVKKRRRMQKRKGGAPSDGAAMQAGGGRRG